MMERITKKEIQKIKKTYGKVGPRILKPLLGLNNLKQNRKNNNKYNNKNTIKIDNKNIIANSAKAKIIKSNIIN